MTAALSWKGRQKGQPKDRSSQRNPIAPALLEGGEGFVHMHSKPQQTSKFEFRSQHLLTHPPPNLLFYTLTLSLRVRSYALSR